MPKWILAARLMVARSQGSVTSSTVAPAARSRSAEAAAFAATSASTS